MCFVMKEQQVNRMQKWLFVKMVEPICFVMKEQQQVDRKLMWLVEKMNHMLM